MSWRCPFCSHPAEEHNRRADGATGGWHRCQASRPRCSTCEQELAAYRAEHGGTRRGAWALLRGQS